MIDRVPAKSITPFNGPIEVGLRALAILNAAFPASYSLQRLIILDYLVIHSDDIPDGPVGLHPKTPHRSGELLVRRGALQDGLMLFQSRGLIIRQYRNNGVFYSATEMSAAFLETLTADYAKDLCNRAEWLVERFSSQEDNQLELLVRSNLGKWGAEFELESVLWSEEMQ